MPYKAKGKCVYKADTGEKVGCTKGPVKKYLAALHANVPDSKNEAASKQGKEEYRLTVALNIMANYIVAHGNESVKEIERQLNKMVTIKRKSKQVPTPIAENWGDDDFSKSATGKTIEIVKYVQKGFRGKYYVKCTDGTLYVAEPSDLSDTPVLVDADVNDMLTTDAELSELSGKKILSVKQVSKDTGEEYHEFSDVFKLSNNKTYIMGPAEGDYDKDILFGKVSDPNDEKEFLNATMKDGKPQPLRETIRSLVKEVLSELTAK